MKLSYIVYVDYNEFGTLNEIKESENLNVTREEFTTWIANEFKNIISDAVIDTGGEVVKVKAKILGEK